MSTFSEGPISSEVSSLQNVLCCCALIVLIIYIYIIPWPRRSDVIQTITSVYIFEVVSQFVLLWLYLTAGRSMHDVTPFVYQFQVRMADCLAKLWS